MTTTYYSVTTDAFSTFLNDFIISGSTTLDLTGWSVKLGTGNLQPTHETTDLINVIYDKDTTGYLGFTASVYASGGQLISIPIPNSVLEGNIITEIGLYDSNDVLMCAAATYLDLTRTSAQGLQPNFIEQLVLKDIPSGVTVVYETWDDYQLRSEKNQANGYAGLDANAKLPIIHIPTGVELTTNKGVANGYCGLNNNSQIPSVNIPNITNCIIETPNNLIWEDITNGVRLKAGSVITFPDGFKEDGTTRKFKKFVLESDIDSTYTGSNSGQVFICLRPYNDTYTLSRFGISTAVCGDNSTPMTTGLLYNESTNTIQNYSSGSYQYDTSFPIGIFDLTSKKLIQSFNCFGFIGVATFILDGTKYLIADGRNENGDLKNKSVTISKPIINVGSSGTGLENYKATSIVTTSLNYIKTTRVYYARTIADLPTISENARNMGFVEETNKWYQIHRTGGINDWTESTYYVIPMCDFKYDSAGAYIESCSVPRVEPLINSSNADGQWVASYKEIITSGTPPTLADVSFDLSSYLPNDGYNYEVLFSTVGITGNVSGNSIVIILHTDLQPYNVYLCSTKTRTSSTFYGSGSAILPVGSGRRVDVNYNSSNSGSYDLYALGYRRLGINQ